MLKDRFLKTEIDGIKAYVGSTEDGYIDFGYVVDGNSDIVIKTKLNTVELTCGEVILSSYLKVVDEYQFFIKFYDSAGIQLYHINGNDRYTLMVLGNDIYALDSWIYCKDSNVQVSYVVNCLQMVFKDDIDILIKVLRLLGFNVNDNVVNNTLDIVNKVV